jgi:3-phenylpropionate/trans-cinnamate dioxygenase ferredoxin reductase component
MSDEAYVVVGASLAGARAAEALRAAGAEGRLVLLGEEDRPPYERPELSKSYLAGDKAAGDLAVLDEDWYEKNGVELLLGRTVTGIERGPRTVQLADGERIGYDRLLITTGSSVRRLPVPGADLDGVLYLRRLGDSDTIKAAIAAGGPVVVIGAGWIGLEVAAVARSKGVDVALLESAPTPLSAVVGEQVGATFSELHRGHGVDVRMGVKVAEIVGAGRVEGVRLDDGTVLPAATVVAGVGISPRTELAEAAGLDVDNGILVDGRLRSSDERIWAAGDVANAQNAWAGRRLRVEHFANANDQGSFVGRSMAGEEEQWAVPPFFWSDQYDVGLEYRGWADPKTARTVVRGTPNSGDPWFAFWLDGDRVAAAMHVNGWDDADTVKALVVGKAVVDADALADAGRPLGEARA